jgi:hypothetical protein
MAAIFSKPSRPALGPIHPPVNWVPGPFPGSKAVGAGLKHIPPSSAEVKQIVELYVCPSSGLSWPVVWRALPLPYLRLTSQA